MRRWVVLVLAAAVALLLVIGIAALAGYLLMRKQPFDVPKWQDPRSQITPQAIDPALAVAGLSGIPDGELVRLALETMRPDTAFAILVLSPSMGDRESAGDLLLLAQRYRAKGQLAEAVTAYRLAGVLATLSPDLSDTERAETSALAGKGLAELNEYGLAELYFDQTFNILAHSHYIQAATRRSLWRRLQEGYLAIGEREQARHSLEKSGEEIELAANPELLPVLPVAPPPPLPEALQQVELTRRQAAEELANTLRERGGKAPAELIGRLGRALLDEDGQRLAYYESQLASGIQLSAQISVVRQRLAWLALKYRVALRGYGLSLVPDWEEQAEAVRVDLTKAYQDLYAKYHELVDALPDASQIDLAREEVLRREILDGTLGRYPNYPAVQRINELIKVTAGLVEAWPRAKLWVTVQPYGGVESFILVDDRAVLEMMGSES